jgi:hypothetical protein
MEIPVSICATDACVFLTSLPHLRSKKQPVVRNSSLLTRQKMELLAQVRFDITAADLLARGLRQKALRGRYTCMALRFITAAISLIAVFPQIGYASLRCPRAVVGQPATGSEAAEITSLWQDLAAPATDGSDGPLGCPVDLVATNDTGSGWSGLVQRFQRGYILIGQGSSAGFEVAAMRGLGGWFVWWNAPSSMDLATNSCRLRRMTKATRIYWCPWHL